MANATGARGVYRIDTSASLPGVKYISAIKYIGNASGTAIIYDGSDTSGQKLWEESGSSNTFNPELELSTQGVYVALTNSAVVYIYTNC